MGLRVTASPIWKLRLAENFGGLVWPLSNPKPLTPHWVQILPGEWAHKAINLGFGYFVRENEHLRGCGTQV